MSVAEMKVKAAEALFSLKNEENIKSIMDQIEKAVASEHEHTYNLSKHFEDLSSRYDETLKKLAQ
jgi:hypothetical protein